MSAPYCGHWVEVGMGIVGGYGEDRDAGEVLEATHERIVIAWVGGACRTTIDRTRHTTDDDSVSVYPSLAAAEAAL